MFGVPNSFFRAHFGGRMVHGCTKVILCLLVILVGSAALRSHARISSQSSESKAEPSVKTVADPTLQIHELQLNQQDVQEQFVLLADSISENEFDLVKGVDGYWRLGRTPQGVWWFVSPDGQREWINSVTTVQPFQLGRRPAGPHFISTDWDGEFDTNYGNIRLWADRTLVRVKDAGFKALGAWCHPIFHELDIPVTRDLNIWAHVVGEDRLLYSPNWKSVAEDAIVKQVVPLRDNKNLIGYYTDNELDWGDTGSGPSLYFDNLDPNDPNRRKVIEVIREIWPDLKSFNQSWGLDLPNWEMLDQIPMLPREHANTYATLLSAWLERLASDYFEMTSELIRRHDPNHLILGVRFKGNAPIEVVRGMRGKTDAVSINYYVADAKLDPQMFPQMYEAGQQPIIVTEFSFHALDGSSGNRNTFGFTAQVLDQEARAEGYKVFSQRLARVPYIVGADWFQWADEPPSGRTSDGEDVNFGVVDIDDRPYPLLVDAIKKTTPTLNKLHAASTTDVGGDVFRESFPAPTFSMPYKNFSLRINGELSDWPSAARLSNIRHSETLGLDRSPLPLPNVYLAWDENGVYVGIEMFDRDISGAPAQGWWWTRDFVELFFSTRPPTADQRFYTQNDSQFFFVPIAFPEADGNSGVVGQWHRMGDSIDYNLIPHPHIQEASRIHPDRYVVEMFIPAASMPGFDPTGKIPMAFNFGGKNFQSAVEYFWSAPKTMQTQLRPGTWGRLNMNGPDENPVNRLASGNDN